MTIWVSLSVTNLVRERDYVIENSINENRLRDQNTSDLINQYFQEIVENIMVIRDANEVTSYLQHPTKESKVAMTEMFLRIMQNKDHYDQLRFIDRNGMEQVRVDNNGVTVSCDESYLQYKGDRYYFKESYELEKDGIYISPMDLNIENGELEMPLKPMIRIATPVYNSSDEKQGIIVINYKADYFLELLKEHDEHQHYKATHYEVINAKGEYILHEKPNHNFSFMYDALKNLNYKEDHPSLWRQFEEQGYIGSSVTPNQVVTFYNLLDKANRNGLAENNKWIMVHTMDSSNMLSLLAIKNELFFSGNAIIGLIVLCAAYIIAVSIDRLKSKNLELDITQRVAESTNDAIIITDSKNRITYVNKQYEKSTGYSSDEVLGLKPSHFKSGKHGKEFYKKMWTDIINKGVWEGTLWDKKKNGLFYPKRLKIIAVRDNKTKRIHHYVGIFSDLSTDVKQRSSHDEISYKDGQMIVQNEEVMIELLSQSVQNKNFTFMVLYISIENYSQLISLLDEESIDPSQIFMNLAKPFLKEDDFIAQTGRNIFAIIIGMHNLEEASNVYINRLHKELSKVFDVNGRDVFFKMKIGVSFWPQDTEDIKKLLLNSMIALEWTAHRNEGEIAYFEDFMIDELKQKQEIEGHLRKAIEKNELSLVYQPQVDIENNKVVGMEALLRWHSDIIGPVSPALFIPIAEKNHLMIEIGDWIINRVCEDLNVMNQACKLSSRELRCAINLSSIQLEEVKFYDKFMSILQTHEIETKQVEIEITEGLILSNEKKNIKLLEQMRRDGIHVAIDDFGTGYSSLSYLNTLPIDKIKIDRSFIKNFPNRDDGKLINILVELVKTLDMKVLTEGAETDEQIDLLKHIKCDYVQGYYYSKPLELEAFIEFMKNS